ncbi:MAG: hypothetical protein ACXVB5_11490 [Isosphaeraceae bacterium]
MIHSWLPHEEQDALRKILAHHGLDDTELTRHLAEFCNWIHLHEQSKNSPQHPPFLITVLGGMGIYPRRGQQPKPKEVAA